MEGDRSTLVPSLLDAFASGPSRRAATAVLLAGNFDLDPFRARLTRMLENPFCKVEVLRVMAANNLELTPATRGEILPWLTSDNAALACGAALALLDGGAAEDALAAHWSLVHVELRSQIIRAVLGRDPDSSFATRLRIRALASPYSEEREAVFDSIEADRDCPAHWEALLQRISEGGSEVAGECWRDFARRVRKLAASRPDAIVDRFIRHLNEWCDRGELPRLSWRERKIYSWDLDEWPKSPALAAALDRCILRSDAPSIRLVLALIREAITSGEIPRPVQTEMEKLFSASASPDTPAAKEIHRAVAHRSVFGVAAVRAVLRQRAHTRWSKFIFPRSLRPLLGDDDRRQAARALVPEFLRSGDRRHVAVALEILEELGNVDTAELAQLREWAARALPSWRGKLEACIERLDPVE